MRHNQPLISIVVPMHNSENFIIRCVDSILNQDYKNLELILVDDHSEDNTIEACKGFLIDPRVRLTQNIGRKGASATRNFGMKLAGGEYISFIDSDDIIANNYLSSLYKIAIKYPDYLAMCGYIEFSKDMPIYDKGKIDKVHVILSSVLLANIFLMHSSAWGCLFQMPLIKKYNIRMEEEASFNEDVYFTSKYLSVCRGGVITSNRLYGYYKNPEGIGAHKEHKDLTIKDVNHRAEGYISLQDAVRFTQNNAPHMTKYMQIGYSFIAAEVFLTAERAGVKRFDYCKEISNYLDLKHRVSFVHYSLDLKQKMLVNGIAICPKLIKFILDDLGLLSITDM